MNKIIRLIIITVPPAEIVATIESLRTPICQKFQAPWALNYPPHITLRTGVLVPKVEIPECLEKFQSLLTHQTAFPISTEKVHFDTMEYENVKKSFLYYPVVKDHKLASLNQHLLSYRKYRKSEKTSFQPHVTLLWAHLSVEATQHIQSWIDQDLRYQSGFKWECDNVSLYIQDKQRWIPYHIFPLSKHAEPAVLPFSENENTP